MLKVSYTECTLCGEPGIYRAKVKYWHIGYAIDYCASCNYSVPVDVNWDFFDPEPRTDFREEAYEGLPKNHHI
jgi:hypothetical protein